MILERQAEGRQRKPLLPTAAAPSERERSGAAAENASARRGNGRAWTKVSSVLLVLLSVLLLLRPLALVLCRHRNAHRSHRCNSLLSFWGPDPLEVDLAYQQILSENHDAYVSNDFRNASLPFHDAFTVAANRPLAAQKDKKKKHSKPSPLRLGYNGIYLDPPTSETLAVFFDASVVDPQSMQLHYKLKVKRNERPDGWNKKRPGKKGSAWDHRDRSNYTDNDYTVSHAYIRCSPVLITVDTAYFEHTCINFRDDYAKAKEGKWLTYKFKILAKRKGAKVDDELIPSKERDRLRRTPKHHESDDDDNDDNEDNEIWDVAGQKGSKKKFEYVEEKVTVLKRESVPWPFANENGEWPPRSPNAVGNVMQNYQSFGESEGAAPYIHGGVDIRTTANASCHSPVDGRVVKVVQYSPSDLYWSIMIQDEYDFIWQFHHLDPSTFTVKEGDFVRKGHVIGNVAFWPATANGVHYHHTHMNIARVPKKWNPKRKGYPTPYVPGWTYHNPFAFLNHGTYHNRNPPTSEGRLYLFADLGARALAVLSDAGRMHLGKRGAVPWVKGTVHAVTQLASEFTPSNGLEGYPYSQCPYEVVWFVSKRASEAADTEVEERLVGGDEVLRRALERNAVVGGPTVTVRFDR
ncbi:hypothetical protein BC830DRAFT_116792 [Chytriomyces sp. MP71]|nr:hypothetical protein BC830DRAFT_116792 [Chytriomyces sp. MP71]